MALAGVAMGTEAQDNTIILTLPASDNLSQTSTIGTDWKTIADKVKSNGYGAYAGGQNNSLGNWATNGEGTWALDTTDGTGSITLLGRYGVEGDGFALVLGSDIAAGTTIQSFNFTVNGLEANTLTGDSILGLALYDATGKSLGSAGGATVAGDATTAVTQTLTFDAAITWAEGYKLVAAIDGIRSNPATTAYTLTDISVTGTKASPAIPEPTTATLSLLALAGLVARRRRK